MNKNEKVQIPDGSAIMNTQAMAQSAMARLAIEVMKRGRCDLSIEPADGCAWLTLYVGEDDEQGSSTASIDFSDVEGIERARLMIASRPEVTHG